MSGQSSPDPLRSEIVLHSIRPLSPVLVLRCAIARAAKPKGAARTWMLNRELRTLARTPERTNERG